MRGVGVALSFGGLHSIRCHAQPDLHTQLASEKLLRSIRALAGAASARPIDDKRIELTGRGPSRTHRHDVAP